jgi:hypothetical protein
MGMMISSGRAVKRIGKLGIGRILVLFIYIQGVTGGTDQISGGYSLC